MDMYKLNEIVWEEFGRFEEKLGLDDALDIWDKNLSPLGVRTFHVTHEQEPHDLVCDVIRIGLENSDCVLVNGGPGDHYDIVYAIPKELAEKILVLGAMPIEELVPNGQLNGQGRT